MPTTACSCTGVSSSATLPSPTSPSAATEEQYTIRSTPAVSAASISSRVPSTLACIIAAGSGTQSR